MSDATRREFMRVGGALLGGAFVGSTVVAAERVDRFLVDTNDATPDALERAGLEIVTRLDGIDLVVVAGSEDQVDGVTDAYGPDIEVTQLDPEAGPRQVEVSADGSAVDDPLYPYQWDKQAINVAAAQETATGDGATIAVIDTGVDPDHPDLGENVDTDLSRNFVGENPDPDTFEDRGYHGTFVAGVAAAPVNRQLIAGVAPDATIAGLRVFPKTVDSGATFSDILEALLYAVAIDADVANLSLGAYPIPRQALAGFYGRVVNRAFTYVNSQGTLPVVAAGNNDADLQKDKNLISLPNEAAQAVSVSATGPVGFAEDGDPTHPPDEPFERPTRYTNYGTNAIDMAAPGGAVTGNPFDLVLGPAPPAYVEDAFGHPQPYLSAAGTSFAAPQVAGIAALLREVDPSLTADQVEAIIERTASVPEEYDKTYYGAGFVDAAAAVDAAVTRGGNGNAGGNDKGN